VLDLFNHDATPHVAWNLTGADGEWVATAAARAARGEQLFIDYGHPQGDPRHERHFVASYGFSHVTADRHSPPAADDLLSSTLAAARELAEEEADDAQRALRWPRSWPPSPYQGWLWCESCPASVVGEGGAGEPTSDAQGWAVSDECRRQAKDFGESRAGKCVTLGADCPPPRRRRVAAAQQQGIGADRPKDRDRDELR